MPPPHQRIVSKLGPGERAAPPAPSYLSIVLDNNVQKVSVYQVRESSLIAIDLFPLRLKEARKAAARLHGVWRLLADEVGGV